MWRDTGKICIHIDLHCKKGALSLENLKLVSYPKRWAHPLKYWRALLFLYSKAVNYKHPWKDGRTNEVTASACKMCTNERFPNKISPLFLQCSGFSDFPHEYTTVSSTLFNLNNCNYNQIHSLCLVQMHIYQQGLKKQVEGMCSIDFNPDPQGSELKKLSNSHNSSGLL